MLKEFFYASKITKIKNRECSPNSKNRMMDFTNLFAKYFANTFFNKICGKSNYFDAHCKVTTKTSISKCYN